MCYSQFDFHFEQPPENNKTRRSIMSDKKTCKRPVQFKDGTYNTALAGQWLGITEKCVRDLIRKGSIKAFVVKSARNTNVYHVYPESLKDFQDYRSGKNKLPLGVSYTEFDAIVCGHCESLVKWALIHDKKTIIDLFNRYIDHATCLLAKSYNTGKGK